MNKRVKTLLKVVLLLVFCYFLGVFIGYLINHNYRPKEPTDFKIWQSFVMGADNYKDTRLKVIVYVDDYDIDAMYDQIIKHHKKLNGMSDRLNIELFNGHKNFEEYNLADERSYIKDKDTNNYVIDE